MSGETLITVMGRLTADPELRFTPSGSAVANFTVAVNARKFNKQSNEWENKPAKFWRCEAWNAGKQTLAENIVEVLHKSASVIVYGELETREWEDREGNKRSSDQLRVVGIGKDLSWHQGNSPHQASGQSSDASWSTAAAGWGATPDAGDITF